MFARNRCNIFVWNFVFSHKLIFKNALAFQDYVVISGFDLIIENRYFWDIGSGLRELKISLKLRNKYSVP